MSGKTRAITLGEYKRAGSDAIEPWGQYAPNAVQRALIAIHGLKIDIEGHEDKALAPFPDGVPEDLLPKRIDIEHPVPDADYPGCTAAFARHGYRLAGRSKNSSFRQLGGPL